jgi:endonuclease YncB( thermonuclease family)
MLRTERFAVAFLLCAVILVGGSCRASAPQSNVISGRVVGVHDGDTITVLDSSNVQHKIRFQGIDAPEKSQAFGEASKQSLSTLVFGKNVSVVIGKKDRYQREVGKVLIGDRDAGLEQLRAGMAWYYRDYERELSPEERRLYSNAEATARSSHEGLWSDGAPTPPWDFRRNDRTNASAGDFKPENSNQAQSVSSAAGPVIGNRKSHTYHLPGCPDYDKVGPGNRVQFNTREEAERAGFRMARNCPK